MSDKQPESVRDRVRALVKDVLENATIIDDAPELENAKNINVSTAPFSEFKPQSSAPEFDRDESAKNLITEDDLRGLEPRARLRVAENARFTALATDFIREKQIELVTKSSRASNTKTRTIAVGADHGGFEFKEKLKDFLGAQDYKIRDFGTNSTEAVDYPDFAHSVARAVADGTADIGIVIDGAGIGSAITANKVANVRAAACYNAALAKNARQHNGANVLTLGSKQNSFAEICEIVTAFLSANLTEERHRKRVEKIAAIERQAFK